MENGSKTPSACKLCGQNPPKNIVWLQKGTQMEYLGEVAPEYLAHVSALVKDSAPLNHKGSPVRVRGVDLVEYNKWLLRRNAKMVEQEQVFPSAMDASLHLGYNCNEVGHALAKDRRRLERDMQEKYGPDADFRLRPEVTLRGVRLQYEDDVRG
jgi:hypothetical protein